ncbi:glycosyltransferase family 2 protein [uncultured Winogradskyella sp.]|uniref:glycosyltransferase family 2 protein n=1 Tax=uncultured Winogradskyella sp. TaxID=395353 RepID=UPI00261A6793|nr:glycosyltransferase family 2 protein [uncultured Winogradskyella sp.]
MKLSVIILNYNVRYFLELCLRSVEAAIHNIDAEVIVVDNNSADDSCKMVKQLFPKVKLIENKNNSGFSKGNNIGVKAAKGEYLCILNPDTVVAEDTFGKIIEFAETKPNCGIIGCQLIDGQGKFLPESKRQIPTPNVAFQKLIGKTDNYYLNQLKPNANGKADILVGAFMVIKKRIYDEVKGFDEDYFMYGEDIDLSYKILKAGYTNYYCGHTTIIHFKGESTLKDKIYAKRFYGAMAIFYEKHFKSNALLTNLIKLGLNLASLQSRRLKPVNVNIEKSIVVSKTEYKTRYTKLKQPVKFISQLEELPKKAMIIFDSESISYKRIIDLMKDNTEANQNAYRIWLKSSNFILGSDSSIGRGEVVNL